MPTYKLTYFDLKGRAEPARLLFALAKQSYEDKRVTAEEWGVLKPTTPFGSLPILEVNGVVIGQSFAIARFLARQFDVLKSFALNRFLARQFGYAGKDDNEAAKIDMIVDAFTDVFSGFQKAASPQDEAQKAESMKKYLAETLPNQLKAIEKLAGSSGWLVGSKISWADLVWFNIVNFVFQTAKVEVDLKDTPKLAKLVDSVAKQRSIAEWLQKYP